MKKTITGKLAPALFVAASTVATVSGASAQDAQGALSASQEGCVIDGFRENLSVLGLTGSESLTILRGDNVDFDERYTTLTVSSPRNEYSVMIKQSDEGAFSGTLKATFNNGVAAMADMNNPVIDMIFTPDGNRAETLEELEVIRDFVGVCTPN